MWNFFRRKRQPDSEKTAVDPICGMTVEKATALKSQRDGQTYYFYSQTCLHTFESQAVG